MASKDRFEDHCWKDVVPDKDIRLYAHYARDTFVGSRPALLAIDLYDSVYRGGPKEPIELADTYPNSCGIHAHRAIEPTKRLFAAARAASLPVFYCTQDTRPNNRPMGAHSTHRKGVSFDPGSMAIYHEFAPQETDILIYKQRASVFQGTPLLSHLNLIGVQSLIVCGESTSGCVRASVVDAYSNGFHVALVEECTFDRSELCHKVNLFDLHHKYVDVMHVDEVVHHLEAMKSNQAATA